MRKTKLMPFILTTVRVPFRNRVRFELSDGGYGDGAIKYFIGRQRSMG